MKYVFSPESKASNLKIACGDHTTVTAADSLDTGLKEVFAITVSLDSDPSNAVGAVNAVKAAGSGTVTIKTWDSLGGSPAFSAATTFGKVVSWIAIGR